MTSWDERTRKREETAEENGRQTAIHGGLRGYNPYRAGKVFGARLHRAWDKGYDAGQALLEQNERMPT